MDDKSGNLFWIAMGILSVGMVGVLDYTTGSEISFSVFYLFPIAMITWVTNWRFGTLSAILSAGIWLWVDLTDAIPYSHAAIPYWNATVRLIFFLLVVLAINLGRRLERETAISRTDFVTGAVNTTYFHHLLQKEIDRSARYSHPLTIVYIDIDNFKTVNDTFGHIAGDKVLRTIARKMHDSLRSTDTVARVGGDEFALILPETNQDSAQVAVSKMQKTLSEKMKKDGWPVTFSIGVITFINMPKSDDAAVDMADRLMYAVKTGGKNNISYSIY
jgi:diguanylate cyclase (GGDEF)-like protein